MITDRAAAVTEVFTRIWEDVFQGDPIANDALRVEVLEEETVGDMDTLAVVTPWAVFAMGFPAEGAPVPERLAMGGRPKLVLEHELEGIGRYLTVPLTDECDALADMDAARELVHRTAPRFRKALADAFDLETVEAPDRRALLTGRIRPR
jgi:hypothetical protein